MRGAEAICTRCVEGEWNIRPGEVVDGLTPDLAEEFSLWADAEGAVKLALCFEGAKVEL
jgi:hypothetical protein